MRVFEEAQEYKYSSVQVEHDWYVDYSIIEAGHHEREHVPHCTTIPLPSLLLNYVAVSE